MPRSRKTLLTACGVAAVTVLCFAYGYFIEPYWLRVNETEIRIEGWDTAFDGLKITAVSDLHAGFHPVDHAMLRRVVDTVNQTEPDVIVLLGDFVSNHREMSQVRMPAAEIASGLTGLKARLGVFAVLGNHDGFYDTDLLAGEFEKAGIRVLQDEVSVIEQNGKKLRIFGMIDHLHMGGWKDFNLKKRRALATAPAEGQIIVLQHGPDIFPAINALNTFGEPYKLMLSGHTHGGQIRFPILGAPMVPSSFGQKYTQGHITENGKHLFVTTGVGNSILPFRFMSPPEIAVLTIRTETE